MRRMESVVNAIGIIAFVAVLLIWWHVMNRCRNDRGYRE